MTISFTHFFSLVRVICIFHLLVLCQLYMLKMFSLFDATLMGVINVNVVEFTDLFIYDICFYCLLEQILPNSEVRDELLTF